VGTTKWGGDLPFESPQSAPIAFPDVCGSALARQM
jgi:hypothetical protein